MTITKTQESEKITLSLHGRLDTSTSPQLQDTLLPAFEEAQQIELDLANLAYVSSAGLRVLLMGQKTANAKSASLTISNVPEDVMEVFDMTGFSNMLNIVDSK